MSEAQENRFARTSAWAQVILSVLYTAGYFAMLYVFLTGSVGIPESFKAEFNMVLGFMTAAQAKLMDFWFKAFGSK